MEWLGLFAALVVILVGAEMFTNGVEWMGEQHGLSEGAVGSVLAAVGTALPETILPLIAILFGGAGAANEEIGIGAILGAPFMLTTLAMFVLGVAVLIFSRKGRRSTELRGRADIIVQDLRYFLAMYLLAVLAGLVHFRPLHWALAVALFVGYGFYVHRHFEAPGEKKEEEEAAGEVKPLYLWVWMHGRGERWSKSRSRVWTYFQVAVSLVLIVGGAKLFVAGVGVLADALGVPALVFALLMAPIATELPEKFNSVIWLRRKKDTLALGNMTGAMVFQSSFPVSVGLLFTDWNLAGNQAALVSAALTLVAGSVLWLTMRARRKFQAWALLLQGLFYAGYLAYVVLVVVPGS